MLDISCTIYSQDFNLFRSVIDQGIDSRLEAFTKSKFTEKRFNGHIRIYFYFDDSEIQILLRRLLELNDEYADSWIKDIVYTEYGIEIN